VYALQRNRYRCVQAGVDIGAGVWRAGRGTGEPSLHRGSCIEAASGVMLHRCSLVSSTALADRRLPGIQSAARSHSKEVVMWEWVNAVSGAIMLTTEAWIQGADWVLRCVYGVGGSC
jgi:hypothetical protein